MDPRLNSIHLPEGRRELFRAARRQLLNHCGEFTLAAVPAAPAEAEYSHTVVADLAAWPRGDAACWLIDHELIHPLKVGFNTVGRSSQNDVVVHDAYVSRRHCAILMHHNAECELHDIASKNGTSVNGQPLRGPTRLRAGDRITLNGQSLIFMTRDASALAAEADHTLRD